MGRIPDEVIQRVRDAADIASLVGRFVSLKPSGRNHLGLCPFHSEKTPSFTVSPDRGTFKCFGCGEGGNAISFLMKMENLSFPEAVRALGREHGIPVPEAVERERGLSEQLFEANELAQGVFRAALPAGIPYLTQRGIDAQTIERFGIGFAPDRWDAVAGALAARGLSGALGERAGLLKARTSGGYYDRLRGRVTFPIRDVRGRILGFGGRAVSADQEPKYLNTPESPIYRKREAFFGLPAALEPIRRHERAVVVEGYFDLLALRRAGVEGVLATCGTALTAEHARQLRRRTERVVVLFDGDEAGQRAMERSLEVLLPEGLRVHAALLPPGCDPDDALAAEGPEALRARVDAAAPALDVVLKRVLRGGVATPAAKADAVAALAPLLDRVGSAIERGAWAERVALAVGTERRHVEAALRAERRGEDPHAAVPIAPRRDEARAARKLERLAAVLIQHPELRSGVSAAQLDGALEELGADHPAAILARRLAGAGDLHLETIAAELGPEARSLLYTLSVTGGCDDADAAARTIEDTVDWLRARQQRARQRELTRRLRDGDDFAAILREKQTAGVPGPSPPWGDLPGR